MTQLYVVTSAQSSSSTPECDCLAHRFGNAADHPDRRPCYGTDMTDAKWVVVRAALPVPAWMDGRGGRPEGYRHRQMIDAIRYLVDNGTKWRNLPADFPLRKRVYAFFRRWRDNALIREFRDRLRDRVRKAEGRNTEPTAAVTDSQSVKADATVKNDSRGFDGGRKINGRKRHLIVDCLGLLLMVLVTPASTTDRDAADTMLPILRAGFRKPRLVWADSGYTGHLIDWAARTLDLILQVVKRSDDTSGFTVLPRRWVVERSLAWLMRSRRLAPRLRNAHGQQRGHDLVVHDHGHEPSPGPPHRHYAAAAAHSGAGSVNRPGFSSASQPRSTSRFILPRAPSTRVTKEQPVSCA